MPFENLPVISLLASFFFLVSLFFLNFKDIKNQFSKIKPTTWFFLSIVFIISLYILVTSPSIFLTLHDETSYLARAKDISQGNFYYIDKHLGFPVILGMVFLFSGANLNTAYAVNIVVGCLSIAMVFLVTYLLFREEYTALYSSILMGLFVPHIIVARSMESNVFSTFAFLLAIFCFLLYFKIGNFRSQLLAAVSLSFAIHFRLEFVLLILIFIFMVLIFEKNLKKKVKDRKWWVPWLFSFFLAASWITLSIQIALLPPGENPFMYQKVRSGLLTLEDLTSNIQYVDHLFINSNSFPKFMVFFLFLGPLSLILRYRKELVFLLSIFFVFTLIYLSYFVPLDRFFLISYVVLILFWAKGISFLTGYLREPLEGVLKTKTPLIIFLISSLLIFASFIPHVISFQEDPIRFSSNTGFFWEEREVYLEREAYYLLNKNLSNCDVVVVDKEFLVFENLNPVEIRKLLNNPEMVKESEGCLLFFEDMHCQFPYVFYGNDTAEEYNKLCGRMHEEFNLAVFRKFNATLPENFKNFKPKAIDNDWATFTLYNISSY